MLQNMNEGAFVVSNFMFVLGALAVIAIAMVIIALKMPDRSGSKKD